MSPGILHKEVMAQLDAVEKETGVESPYDTASARFRHIIQMLHSQAGQRVVILVDEYDKPILDVLDESEVARANRDFLRGLYSTIKSNDAHIKFTFLTGVSKFSKVQLFSGLNNLKDITLDTRYSAICGYTDADLDTVFAPELPGLDREEIRDWYNGYSWRGEEKVYNPFDILLLFDSREFGAYWFETGTPTFLIEMLFNRRVSSLKLDEMIGSSDLLSTFDVDEIATEALLFQTGYLTITGEENLGGKSFYRLGYPNREVRQSLNERPIGLSGERLNASYGKQRSTLPSARSQRLRRSRDLIPRLFLPVFLMSGTLTTTSPILKATIPACSIPISRDWDSILRLRIAAAMDVWI